MNGKAWLGILVIVGGLAACGDDDASADACEGSPFVGHHLWNIGNCESGTVTSVASATCGVTLCGGNAREPIECAGDRLFEFTVSGTDFESDGTSEPMALTRELDCTDSSVSAETCAHWQCAIANERDIYVQRFPERAAGEQFIEDGLWMLMDKPWPARNACVIDPDLEAKLAALAIDCPLAAAQ